VRLGRVADAVGPGVDHELEQVSTVEARATDQEIICRPFTALVLPPCLAQPFAVGLETAGSQNTCARFEASAAAACGDEPAALQLDRVHRRLVQDLHAECLGAAVVGVHERFAATHEKGIGTGHMQGAGQWRLEAHAVFLHPWAAVGRCADGEARQVFVGDAAGDLEQVLPVFFFRVGIHEHVLWTVVHATKIARMLGIAAAPFTWRRFEQ